MRQSFDYSNSEFVNFIKDRIGIKNASHINDIAVKNSINIVLLDLDLEDILKVEKENTGAINVSFDLVPKEGVEKKDFLNALKKFNNV